LQSQGLLVGLSDFRGLAVANLLQFGVVLLGLVAVWSVGWPAVAVLFVWALGLAAKIGYCLFLLPRSDAERPSLSKSLTEQVRHGTRMMFGSLANLLNFRLDTYFIAYFLTTRELGLYAVAATIAEATLYLPKAIGQVVFSWAAAKSRPGESRLEMSKIRYFFLGGTYSSLATVLLVQLLLAPLVALLFEDFSRSIPAARILLLAVFFYGIGLVAMNLLFGLGDPHSNTRAGLTAAAVNATVNLLAIPKFGIAGAAVASLLSYVAFCLLNLIAVKARLARSIRLRHLLIPDADATRRFLGLVRSAMDALRGVSRH
jgi:O-antigen/teichoic acid export membrane protein